MSENEIYKLESRPEGWFLTIRKTNLFDNYPKMFEKIESDGVEKVYQVLSYDPADIQLIREICTMETEIGQVNCENKKFQELYYENVEKQKKLNKEIKLLKSKLFATEEKSKKRQKIRMKITLRESELEDLRNKEIALAQKISQLSNKTASLSGIIRSNSWKWSY